MDHFKESQRIERESITKLFNNYFKPRGCSHLVLTSEAYYSEVDAFFISGNSNVAVEYKRRNISIEKYFHYSCIIEETKYRNLYAFHTTSTICLYIVHFDDAIAVFNMNRIFESREPMVFDFFVPVRCTSNMESYQHGQREKMISNLDFALAAVFITETYEQRNYKQFQQYLRERESKNNGTDQTDEGSN
jgi:hypothetical protein